MSTPALFDLETAPVVPVKGQPWPWPRPAGFDVGTHDRCTAIDRAWHYCWRDAGHAGPHAECNAAGTVTAVWHRAYATRHAAVPGGTES